MLNAKHPLNGHDSMMQPLFLVGCERSGTTLTVIMLDHHPQIAFWDFYFAVEMLPEDEGWPDMEAYYSYLQTDRGFQAMGLSIDRNLDYPHLADSFLRQWRERSGKPIVGGKIRDHFHRLLRMWPKAKFIHLLRDGRDAARSLIEMGWVGNMYTAGEYWLKAEQEWDKLCQLVPPERRTELRYEDMVSDPIPTLTRICKFVGVPYDPAMLSYPNDTSYGPPSTSSIGQWKRKLTPEQIRLAEACMGDTLVSRGYELSGESPLVVDAAYEKRLRLQSRLYCAEFRRKRFGTALFLADMVSRRLGLSAPQARIKKRMNAIETTYLK